MTLSWEEAYKAIEPSNKSKEIASEKIFGFQPFTPEQIEKQRHKVGIGLKGLASGLIGSLGDISEFAQGIVGIKKPIKILPSSEDVGKFFEEASGEKFSPQTTGESLLEKSTSGLGSILGLGGPIKAGPKIGSAARTALAAFVPAGVATIAEKEKLPEWAQVASTLGSAFLLHRMTGKGLKDMQKALYREVDSLMPSKSINAPHLVSGLKNLKSDLQKGLKAPSEKAVLSVIDEFQGKIKKGKISPQELISSRRSLSEMNIIDEVKKSPRAKLLLKKIIGDVDKTIEGMKGADPKFVETYRQANSLHRGMQQSKAVERFILGKPELTKAGAAFLSYTFPVHATTGAALAKLGAIGNALSKNPGLRKAYWDVLKNASKEDLKGTFHSLKKFNALMPSDLIEKGPASSSWEEAFDSL